MRLRTENLTVSYGAQTVLDGLSLALPAGKITALTGALLLVIADLLARIIHPPLELPAGVLTAIIGAPWFVWLLVRMR
ncbi:Fe(3+) dicitrate transport system permease fecD [Enterobacter sp. MGH 15]|nr:Fe(3+) dicitrate transport system permease fecD [Enterobacter sp. MGH 15]